MNALITRTAMSQPFPTLPDLPPPPPLTWRQVWERAITQPYVVTFTELLHDRRATTARACLWVFLSALVSSAFLLLIKVAFGGLPGAGGAPVTNQFSVFTTTLLLLLVGSPLIALAVLGLFSLGVALAQFNAGQMGGTGTYRELAYASAAYWAPLTLLGSILAVIPCLNYTDLLIVLYGLIESFVVLKAVHQLDWGKTILAGMLAILVLVILVFLVLNLLGPVIRALSG